MTKQEREELCIALTAAQESAIIQLLLEICLPTEEDQKVKSAHLFSATRAAEGKKGCLGCQLGCRF